MMLLPMGRDATDYQVDRSGGSTLALCRHCDQRVIRAERDLAVAAMCEHLRTAHADDPLIARRMRRR